jgi:NitT/TauT family transport system ATP-binding protein
LITEAFIPDTPLQTIEASKRPKHVALEALPNVQITEIIGLLETIENEGGQQDIFELAQEIKLDYGRTLYIVKAGELLGLVETPQQMVVVTALGNQFLQADINKKKSLLHELFGNLRIVRMITGFLRKEENFRLSTEVLLERIKKWLPNENPHHILETIIAWGRFAEYFGYSDNRKEVYLDIGQETL